MTEVVCVYIFVFDIFGYIYIGLYLSYKVEGVDRLLVYI